MISVEEAKELINKSIFSLAVKEVRIIDALDHFLIESIIAPVSIPLFNQSAMDGYAFRFDEKNSPLKVVETIPAGDTRIVKINEGEAVRIFTGSKVPDCCDTVVMQELTEVKGDLLSVKDEGLKLGGNVRTKGNQITVGELALKKGTKITAGAIGFLAALGIENVKVNQSPKVAVIATGSELIKPGNDLKEGQIYESNTFMLQAALNKLNIEPQIITVKDDETETVKAIEAAINNSDLVLLSGGISVGDYDFVKSALDQLGVEDVFYKIKQKPGKPLYFGKTASTYVFALPGNPAAALSCFYVYVLSAIKLMMGSAGTELKSLPLPVTNSFSKKAGRANFLKGVTDFKTVTILDGQGSDALQSFAMANCLVYISEDVTSIKQGEVVQVSLLPV